MDINNRISDINNIIRVFRRDQENLILKSNLEEKISSNSKSKIAEYLTRVDPAASLDSSILKVLNVDCIIMPVSEESRSHRTLWPQAIVTGNSAERRATIGLIESQGSIWKLVQHKDAFPGYRAIIQSSEIGEPPRYLGRTLELLDNKVQAALWNIELCVLGDQHESTVTNDKSQTKGLPLKFSLVDRQQSVKANSPVLMCETVAEVYSKQFLTKGASDLVLAPAEELQVENDPDGASSVGGESAGIGGVSTRVIQRTLVWEVVPESWIDGELDFLENFLH